MTLSYIAVFLMTYSVSFAEDFCNIKTTIRDLQKTAKQVINKIKTDQLCQRRKNLLETSAKNGALQRTLSQIAATDSTVIAIGEMHETYLDQKLAGVVENLAKQDVQINCLVLEYNPNTVKRIEEYLSNSSQTCLPDDVSNRLPIFLAARKLGLKLVAGEVSTTNKNLGIFLSLGPEFLNNRDIGIAGEIERKTKSGECKKSIAIYGADHITDAPYLRTARNNFVKLLRSRGVSVTSVQAVVTGQIHNENGIFKDRRWINEDCENSNPSAITKDFGFLPRNIDAARESRGSWSDVEFVIGFRHQTSYKPTKHSCAIK